MNPAVRRQIALAFRDLLDGTRIWRTWYVLGVSEMRQKYRRSTLGPLWVTLTVGTQALVMGVLLSYLFHTDINRHFPFICISLVTWTFIAGVISEGANCFIGMSGAILQVKRPLWTYVMLTLWRNAIVYAHTILVFVAAACVFHIVPGYTYFLAPLGLALLVINLGWIALAAGIISARFRDVPLLVSNVLNVLMWLTPVFYHPSQLGPVTRSIIELNPLTHVLEVARAPLLNEAPPLPVWISALAFAGFGWLLTFGLLARTRARVPYWV